MDDRPGAHGARLDLAVRPFDPSLDLDAVITCYQEGYGPTIGPVFEYSKKPALVDLVMTDHRASDISLVAEAAGRARGVLFGSLPAGAADRARQAGLVAAMMFRRMVLHREEMRPFARAVLWRAVSREFLSFRHMPRGRAAGVGVLTSERGWRGGIGRALMDAFVEEARERGFRRVDLATDTELNWAFYERYGFRRVAEWPQRSYDYTLPGREMTGYTYSLDI
jgi:ribosomal protein S18 acetylase RimI-like enzyme